MSPDSCNFPGGSVVKNPHANEGVVVLSREDPLEEGWQPTPIFLPSRLQSMGSQRVRLSNYTSMCRFLPLPIYKKVKH